MTNIAISALPVGTSASGSDVFPFVQSATTKQISYTNLFTNITLVTPNIGTPTAGVLSSCTGLPITTGVSGMGANVATFLVTPSSANLAAAVTGETGSGALVFGTSPSITGLKQGASATKTASFTLADTDTFIVCNGASASVTITLPAAASWTGRAVYIKNLSGTYTVVSAASDVQPLASATPGTAILAATAGKWAILVSDGTNWVIMAAA